MKVVYAYATDQTGEFQQFSDLIQRDIKAAVELVGDASGGHRSIAFDLGTDCGPRYVDIASVPLNHPSGYYTEMPSIYHRTGAIQRELRLKLGLDRPPEDPVAYADGAAPEVAPEPVFYLSGANDRLGLGGRRNFAVYVNIGTIPSGWTPARGDLPGCPRGGQCQPDDRPGPENIANLGGYWAWVVQDLRELIARRAMLHEITHNLGAVQYSAPHSDREGHCTDGNRRDVMCPPSGAPPATPTCYDCGGDDYFNVNPPPGTYLDTHWNIANSVFTCIYQGSSPDRCGPPGTPHVQWPIPEADPKPCRSKSHNPPEACGRR